MLKTPELTVEEQNEQHGDKLWETNPQSCCHMRKVIPLQEALSGYPAWLSGLRREQSPKRAGTNFLNKDEKFQSVKVCPLIHWTWKDIWRYASREDLTYNPLHDQGYQASGVHLVHSRHLLLMICVLEDGQGQQRLSADYMSKGA